MGFRRISILVLFWLCLFGALNCRGIYAGGDKEALAGYKQAKRLIAGKHYQEALTLLDDLLKRFPQSAHIRQLKDSTIERLAVAEEKAEYRRRLLEQRQREKQRVAEKPARASKASEQNAEEFTGQKKQTKQQIAEDRRRRKEEVLRERALVNEEQAARKKDLSEQKSREKEERILQARREKEEKRADALAKKEQARMKNERRRDARLEEENRRKMIEAREQEARQRREAAEAGSRPAPEKKSAQPQEAEGQAPARSAISESPEVPSKKLEIIKQDFSDYRQTARFIEEEERKAYKEKLLREREELRKKLELEKKRLEERRAKDSRSAEQGAASKPAEKKQEAKRPEKENPGNNRAALRKAMIEKKRLLMLEAQLRRQDKLEERKKKIEEKKRRIEERYGSSLEKKGKLREIKKSVAAGKLEEAEALLNELTTKYPEDIRLLKYADKLDRIIEKRRQRKGPNKPGGAARKAAIAVAKEMITANKQEAAEPEPEASPELKEKKIKEEILQQKLKERAARRRQKKERKPSVLSERREKSLKKTAVLKERNAISGQIRKYIGSADFSKAKEALDSFRSKFPEDTRISSLDDLLKKRIRAAGEKDKRRDAALERREELARKKKEHALARQEKIAREEKNVIVREQVESKKQEARESITRRGKDKQLKKHKEDREKIRKINQLYKEARQLFAREMYEEAIEKFEKVVELEGNPRIYYTPSARKFIDKAKDLLKEQHMENISAEAGLMEKEMINKVIEKGMPPYIEPQKKIEEIERVPLVKVPIIRQRLQKRVTLDFDKVSLKSVMDFLSDETQVNIMLSKKALEQDFSVTAKLDKIKAEEAVKYILKGLGLKHRVDDQIVWIAVEEEIDDENLETRVYSFNKGSGLFTEFTTTTAGEVGLGGTSEITKITTIEDVLKEAVPWPAEAKLVFDKRTGTIIATNTPSNLQKVEDILYNIDVVPYQVLIEARFLEVTINDIEELGLEWTLTGDFPSKKAGALNSFSHGLGSGSGADFTTFSRSSEGLNITYKGVLTSPQYQAVLHMLEENKKTKTLSAPRVTTLNNQLATIKVVDEWIYPTRYEFQIVQNDSNGDGDFNDAGETQYKNVPSDFVKRDIGILLRVVPSVGEDRQTITLSLIPEVSEAVADFFTYTGGVTLPKFTSRNLSTTIVVKSSETVVLGGLIKESRTKTETRVPVLGDLPFIGRAFRKNSDSIERKNLLIFVTAKILSPEGEEVQIVSK
ncbi:MAG: tetratricopeptide repeat protein [Candidatus Omnitrophica bacterium]|nr:tetratricopeptide repeat protein [Candidatus Omnitrophota bacterium]